MTKTVTRVADPVILARKEQAKHLYEQVLASYGKVCDALHDAQRAYTEDSGWIWHNPQAGDARAEKLARLERIRRTFKMVARRVQRRSDTFWAADRAWDEHTKALGW